MKQHSTPQVRRTLFWTVTLLVACCLLLLRVGLLSDTRAHATESGLLPALECTVPVIDASQNTLIQATETAIGTEITRLRTLHGLGSVTVSSVLSDDAYYIAASMLALGETDADTAIAHAQSVSKQLSYITVTAAVYSEDYLCTVPATGATHFCKIILNHTSYSNAILKSNIKEVGVALLQGQFNGETVTCAVICAAETSISQSQSKIPNPVFTADTQAPQATAETIYLALGGTLTGNMVEAALRVEDERGEPPRLTYDLASVNSGTEGEQVLSVTVSDAAGNYIVCPVTVRVATPTLPMIVSETIYLPEIPAEEYWDVAKYVQASDQYAIASVRTEPVFLTAENLADHQTVHVTVTNVFGLQIEADLPVVCQAISYKDVAWDDSGAGLTVGTVSGEEVRQDGHTLLTCNIVENGIYHFTVTEGDGVQRTFIRRENELIWNPASSGEVQVSVTVYNGSTGAVYKTSLLNIIVADKQIFVYNTLVLSFGSESGFLVNPGKLWIYGVQPGTTVSALREAALVTGGSGEITFSFVNAKGEALEETEVLPCGTVVSLLEDGKVRGTYTVLIYGDTNGDGLISIADFTKLRHELLRGDVIKGIYIEAADVNYDGQITISDFTKLRQHLLGRIVISQKSTRLV